MMLKTCSCDSQRSYIDWMKSAMVGGALGWQVHQRRNRALLLSGAILFFFIFVLRLHLTIPYFPSSLSDGVSSPSSSFNRDSSCVSFLNDVAWDPHNSSSYYWARSPQVVACQFQRLARANASDLLSGSWVVVAGDSQARLFVVSLLGLVLDSEEMEAIRGDLFKRHSDYRHVVGEIGLKLDFVWAPYEANLTGLVMEFKRNLNYPDVLVMGSGLWHMLHLTNSSDYGVWLTSLRNELVGSGFSAHLFWLGMPRLINSMLNTEEKRVKMSDAVVAAYDREIYQSKLLRQFGGGPLLLLDVESLSRKCGVSCTVDGMHYDGVVYEAAVHVMLNTLRI
ncbi:hypothetical protein VitviT2T_016811 [Vitis vinifera]|uniref:Uncharacterized protein n=3 Tax=Vitis vinifera TaxID=29760 RepID=A0ABY9CUG7_VITVI|nr:hypothetical protein VitviT2T_016811 [Vitis vinifera]